MYLDRTANQTNTTGTGTLTLIGPLTGYQQFSAFGHNQPAAYVIAHPTLTQWEVGIGTVLISGPTTTLARTTVLASSNAGALVNFSAGRKDVKNTIPASLANSLANAISDVAYDATTWNGVVAVAPSKNAVRDKIESLTTAIAALLNAEQVDDRVAGLLVAGSNITLTYNDAANTLTIASTASGGTGDVVGPASSIANAAPVFSGTTGKLLRSSPTVTYHPVAAGAEDKVEFGATFKDFRTATDGATVTFDLDLSDQWQVTFAGNRTLAFSNASLGQTIAILRHQDATGNRTPTWWSNIAWDNGLAPVDDPTSNGWSLTVLVCVGLDAYSVPNWKEVCRSTSAPRRGITTATDGATVTFDLRVSPKQRVTLSGNRTLALTSGSYYVGQMFAIKLTQDGTGSHTVTWWSAIKWPGGTAPTLTTTAGKSDWFCFVCTDASGSPKFDCVGMSLNLGT